MPEDPVPKRDASSQSGGHIGWCGVPGGSCPEPPSTLDGTPNDFNENLNQARDAEPQIEGGTIDWCGVPGASCPVPVKVIDEPIAVPVQPREPQTIGGGTIDWCGVPGAGCPAPVRVVDTPAAVAIEPREPQIIEGGTFDWCGVPGAGCPAPVRVVEEPLPIPIEPREPQIIEGGTIDWCGVPGASCPAPIRVIDEPVAIPIEPREPQIIEGGTFDWCGVPGAGCPAPVRVVDKTTALQPREPQIIEGGTIDWCGVPGAGCPAPVRVVEDIAPRYAEPQIEGGTIDWCGVPGSSCNGRSKPAGQGSSDANDVVEDKRDAEAQITGGHIGFCGVPGVSSVRLLCFVSHESLTTDYLQASCVEHYEDEATMTDSLAATTTNMVMSSNAAAEPQVIEVTTVVNFYKRKIRTQATITCTPVEVIGPDDTMSRGGCMVGQGAKENNAVVAAHITTTITQLNQQQRFDNGYLVVAGVADTVDVSSMASISSALPLTTAMLCALVAAAFFL